MNENQLWNRTIGQKKWPYGETLYFWDHSDKYGFLSNWYPCTFTVGTRDFNCVEQYMMFRKAKVANYDSHIWDAVKLDIVMVGLVSKFSQDRGLYTLLMATKDMYLVEASPHDNIWGIGLNEQQCVEYTKTWHISSDGGSRKPFGKNLLGKLLCYVRDDLFRSI